MKWIDNATFYIGLGITFIRYVLPQVMAGINECKKQIQKRKEEQEDRD